METKYTNLKELVGKSFKVETILGFGWKKWDKDANKFLFSKDFKPFSDGWSKKYFLQTDKGKLELGEGQISRLLVPVLKGNVADISNAVYEVASNGKTGMEIRYYFNFKGTELEEIQLDNDGSQDEPDLSGIPF